MILPGLVAWAWYAGLTGALIVLAAEALERLAGLARRPTRWVWAAALIAIVAVLAFGSRHGLSRGAAQPAEDAASQLNTAFVLLWCGCSLTLLARLARSFTSARQRVTGLPSRVLDGVDVLISDSIGPALVGLLVPRIVVPSWILALPRRDRGLVALHEWEHREAGDQWVGAAAELLLALVPWHIAMWYGVRRLRRAIELDCDARVLSREPNVARYGRLLLRCARTGGFAEAVASRLHGPAGTLALRIRAMTAPPPARRVPRVSLQTATVCVALVALTMLRRPAPLVFGSSAPPALPVALSYVDPAVRVIAIDPRGVVTRMRGTPLDARDEAAVANIRGPALVRFIPDPDRPSQLVAIVRYQRQ